MKDINDFKVQNMNRAEAPQVDPEHIEYFCEVFQKGLVMYYLGKLWNSTPIHSIYLSGTD